MVTHSQVSLALWLIGLIVQAGMVLLMVRKRLFEEMPLFFTYTIFQVVRSLLLLAIKSWFSLTVFSYSYWTSESISAVLGFLVINEVFTKVLGGYRGLRHMSKLLFRWALAILVVLAFVAAMSAPSESTPGLIAAVVSLERSVRIVQCGLLLLLFIFASALSISWRNYVFGIALGFGIYAAIELILVSTRLQAGSVLDHVFVFLKPAAYVIAILVWSFYLALPVPSPAPSSFKQNDLLSDWNTAILGMLRQ
jgi:hypothetical protein